MKESMPSPKSQPEQPEKQKPPLEMTVKKIFDNFLARPDEPGLPYSEQNKLLERSRLGDKEAAKQYLESKKSKYRVNSLAGALMAAEMFLTESEKTRKMPEAERKALHDKVRQAGNIINEERKGSLTKDTVDKVVGIVKEIQLYLN